MSLCPRDREVCLAVLSGHRVVAEGPGRPRVAQGTQRVSLEQPACVALRGPAWPCAAASRLAVRPTLGAGLGREPSVQVTLRAGPHRTAGRSPSTAALSPRRSSLLRGPRQPGITWQVVAQAYPPWVTLPGEGRQVDSEPVSPGSRSWGSTSSVKALGRSGLAEARDGAERSFADRNPNSPPRSPSGSGVPGGLSPWWWLPPGILAG